MATITNSSYKTKAGTVQNTTGLALEAGAFVYSIDDAAVMVCDGLTWTALGGGGGISSYQRTRSGNQFFNFPAGGEVLPVNFADTVDFTAGTDIVVTDPATLTVAVGIYSVQLISPIGSAIVVPAWLSQIVNKNGVPELLSFCEVSNPGGVETNEFSGLIEFTAPGTISLSVSSVQANANVIVVGPILSVTKIA